MKIRNGFVSNSSSSSFLIKTKDILNPKKGDFITSEQTKKLLDYGFEFTRFFNICQIEWNDDWRSDETTDALAFSVTCNEHDVMHFLIENDIPFEALTHYGHSSTIWNGVNRIKQMRNPGIELSMHSHWDYNNDEQIYKEFTKDEWISEYNWTEQ